MISVREALHLILQHPKDFGTEEVNLLASTGRMLAQDVFADRDFPPYSRVTMDGIAINSTAYHTGTKIFKIEKIQAAGEPQQILDRTDNCIEVMTGAVLPVNTNAVIPYEHCHLSKGMATITTAKVNAMQNVHLQGTDSKKGELLVEKWQRITPAIIAIIASVGLTRVKVLKMPKITICSTGDELVDISEQPQAHQVRRSNVYMLVSALLAEGIRANTVHLPDNMEEMTASIATLLNKDDVILFSGAISKGKFDYLPIVLEQLGMNKVFHTVAQRPGKPFLFGEFKNGTLIFAFPGNPVSTFVCYHQFFKQWLHTSMQYKPLKQLVVLASDVPVAHGLSYHLLVQVANNKGNRVATPVAGSGSGDLVTLTRADGIILLPAGRDYFRKGEVFEMTTVNENIQHSHIEEQLNEPLRT